jgi:hypothetical protein
VDPGGDLKTAGSFQVPETDDELVGAGDSRRCQWCRSRRITRVHETAVSAVVGDDVWCGWVEGGYAVSVCRLHGLQLCGG